MLVLKCMCLGPTETPLTLAAQLDDPTEVIKALRNGGAHLDFRARDGMTALHKAARARNQVALKVHSGACLTRGTPPHHPIPHILASSLSPSHNSHRADPEWCPHWG